MTEINYYYWATGLTGGGDGVLDSFDGADLNDGDPAVAHDHDTGLVFFYSLDATSGADESSPDIIKPDTNAGLKRWIRTNPYGVDAATFLGLADTDVTYVGQAGKYVIVNAGETGLTFSGIIAHAASHSDGTDDISVDGGAFA